MCFLEVGQHFSKPSRYFSTTNTPRNKAYCQKKQCIDIIPRASEASASIKTLPRLPRGSVNFPEVREAYGGAELEVGIVEVAHQRPRELQSCCLP